MREVAAQTTGLEKIGLRSCREQLRGIFGEPADIWESAASDLSWCGIMERAEALSGMLGLDEAQ